jgi:LacI family transcriptional regulator
LLALFEANHTEGGMVFDIADPYCALILRGIENCLYRSNFLPTITDAHNQRSRFERYLEMMLGRRIEGLILLANWLFLDINLIADLTKIRRAVSPLFRSVANCTPTQ